MIPLKDNVRSRSFPFFNILLILGNIAVFAIELRQPSPQALERFFSQWSLLAAPLVRHPWENWYRVITSMFLHGGWFHLIGNMLYLWVFGGNVEDRVGHFRYLIFYLAVGAVAAFFQVGLNSASTVPMIGASGAIAGIMGAYFVLYPRAKVTTVVPIFVFIRVVEIPAFFFLGFWFLLQAFQGYGSLLQTAAGVRDAGGVAWWAHAGGFVAGFVFIFFFRQSARKRPLFS
jgi:membrane associated rhomboid family serine protease